MKLDFLPPRLLPEPAPLRRSMLAPKLTLLESHELPTDAELAAIHRSLDLLLHLPITVPASLLPEEAQEL